MLTVACPQLKLIKLGKTDIILCIYALLIPVVPYQKYGIDMGQGYVLDA